MLATEKEEKKNLFLMFFSFWVNLEIKTFLKMCFELKISFQAIHMENQHLFH